MFCLKKMIVYMLIYVSIQSERARFLVLWLAWHDVKYARYEKKMFFMKKHCLNWSKKIVTALMLTIQIRHMLHSLCYECKLTFVIQAELSQLGNAGGPLWMLGVCFRHALSICFFMKSALYFVVSCGCAYLIKNWIQQLFLFWTKADLIDIQCWPISRHSLERTQW